MFGLLTHVYGMVAGFLPPRSSLQKLAEQGGLERGLVLGLLIFFAGIGLGVWALLRWRGAHFGLLVYPDILRIVIPSAVSIIVGLQIILGAFFLSVLLIKHK